MSSPLIMPEGWDYDEQLGTKNGYVYASAYHGSVCVVRWAFDWLEAGDFQKAYREYCNKHRLMYKSCETDGRYAPLPDDIETMQQAVDYIHVLMRLGK